MPGCWGPSQVPGWCGEGQTYCPFPPERLQDMMRTQRAINPAGYNEVIVDTATYRAHLPNSLEAFFAQEGGEVGARRAHAHFLHAYNLSASAVPLLRLDLADLEQPFVDIS